MTDAGFLLGCDWIRLRMRSRPGSASTRRSAARRAAAWSSRGAPESKGRAVEHGQGDGRASAEAVMSAKHIDTHQWRVETQGALMTINAAAARSGDHEVSDA